MSTISTHVLDTGLGKPAAGIDVRLEHLLASGHRQLAQSITDADGRVGDFGAGSVAAGTYRLVFDTGAYFAATGQSGFFPEVTVAFTVEETSEHYHVPILLSPFAYSTYRGS